MLLSEWGDSAHQLAPAGWLDTDRGLGFERVSAYSQVCNSSFFIGGFPGAKPAESAIRAVPLTFVRWTEKAVQAGLKTEGLSSQIHEGFMDKPVAYTEDLGDVPDAPSLSAHLP